MSPPTFPRPRAKPTQMIRSSNPSTSSWPAVAPFGDGGFHASKSLLLHGQEHARAEGLHHGEPGGGGGGVGEGRSSRRDNCHLSKTVRGCALPAHGSLTLHQ